MSEALYKRVNLCVFVRFHQRDESLETVSERVLKRIYNEELCGADFVGLTSPRAVKIFSRSLNLEENRG